MFGGSGNSLDRRSHVLRYKPRHIEAHLPSVLKAKAGHGLHGLARTRRTFGALLLLSSGRALPPFRFRETHNLSGFRQAHKIGLRP